MTWRLTTDEIIKYWGLIKYGVNQTDHPQEPDKYLINYLKGLLLGEAICAFLMDDQRKIKLMVIGKVIKDFGGVERLAIICLYGFTVTTGQERKEMFDFFVAFAKNKNIDSIIGDIANPAVWRFSENLGFKKSHEVYKLKIG